MSNVFIIIFIIINAFAAFAIAITITHVLGDITGETKMHDVTPICPDAVYSANGEGITYYINNTTGHMVEAIDRVGMGLIECTVDPEGNYVRIGGDK